MREGSFPVRPLGVEKISRIGSSGLQVQPLGSR
jgi:hypothetical protein